MTFQRSGGVVTTTYTESEYTFLLVMVGYAWGAAKRDEDSELSRAFAKFINAMNAGDPHYRPYATEEGSGDAPVN